MHAVETDDGVELQLLRYRGGDRGPVVLVHGMGACSGLFTTDTIDTNLTEYLWEQGFDVWLLDWRGSILIPASSGTFDADECAQLRLPGRVAEDPWSSPAPTACTGSCTASARSRSSCRCSAGSRT